tara:strand:- start:1478 stop:1771 length:294 start_codon:yes stop_codon:yes gene_type:complete
MGLRINDSDVKQLFSDLNKIAPAVIKDASTFMKRATPINKGNARNKTRLESTNQRIGARYPYADKLDNGWSQQAPRGFTDPTIDEINKLVDQEIRKL